MIFPGNYKKNSNDYVNWLCSRISRSLWDKTSKPAWTPYKYLRSQWEQHPDNEKFDGKTSLRWYSVHIPQKIQGGVAIRVWKERTVAEFYRQTEMVRGRVRCYQLDCPAVTEGTQTWSDWLTLNTTLNSQHSKWFLLGDKSFRWR